MLIKKLFIVLTVCFVFSIVSCKKDTPIPDGNVEISMLDSVNKLRASGCTCGNETMPKVRALVWNTPLAKAAEGHAKDMYNRNYFEHISPDNTSPVQRAMQAGYQGTTVLENIGKGYKDIGAVLSAWKASESHCKAMMDSASVEMGAYSYNGFWVQEFGR